MRSPEGPGGGIGTAKGMALWPRAARDKTIHFLSRPEPMEVSRQKGRESHSQTVNIDLSLPDRDRELGLASIHKARGPDPEARGRRRRLVVDPEHANDAPRPHRGANVKMTFSSVARSRSVSELSSTSARSTSLPRDHPAPRSHHPRVNLTSKRR